MDFTQNVYLNVLQLPASPWTTEASTSERWQFGASTNRKATSSNRAPSTSSLCYYQVALSLYRDKRITIIRLWWLSQWLVTHGHHLAVTIYLHVAPSSGRHITSLSISLKFYQLSSTLNSQFTSSTLTLWFKTIFNGGCYWEGLMAFLSGPLSGAICSSWLHRFELLGTILRLPFIYMWHHLLAATNVYLNVKVGWSLSHLPTFNWSCFTLPK